VEKIGVGNVGTEDNLKKVVALAMAITLNSKDEFNNSLIRC
jgi:hypothetical protein